jgi:hypothetical protein
MGQSLGKDSEVKEINSEQVLQTGILKTFFQLFRYYIVFLYFFVVVKLLFLFSCSNLVWHFFSLSRLISTFKLFFCTFSRFYCVNLKIKVEII